MITRLGGKQSLWLLGETNAKYIAESKIMEKGGSGAGDGKFQGAPSSVCNTAVGCISVLRSQVHVHLTGVLRSAFSHR